jgi:serine/threonine protein kinase/tetratricopeptide (TPR) repeat protein
MNTRTSREEQVFADALARPEHERVAFVDGASNGDAALRDRILALLKAHTGTNSLLNSGPVTVSVLDEEKPGEHIARYKLLQKIGEGGCGVVWMAEQEEPVRRRVALKVIKLGMDTKAVVARFEAERQALAMMDHPNIAKVHDAGATDTGRPFFVMELVRGIPITKYCDENQLTPIARLELFIKVCQAIQHAHQKGVIHRDIKPSNILVTVNDGQPTPKVIDFGIAKATQGKLTDATIFTAFEQFIGTPIYMSPEQAEMSSLDIDTRSDIYSLGVLLYELLTGRPPFDPKKFAEAGIEGIRQQIREVEPPRPSARLSTLDDDERTTIAKLRNTASAELSLILRGDLDWIVMRCIEKDRTRRYDTANGLAADIQRYLRNEPVIARPPSTAYLLQKLVRRHRMGFTAGFLVAASLVVGTIVSVRQRSLAEKSRAEAEKLVDFLLEDFYRELEPTGRLEIVSELATQAIEYYDRLPPVLFTAGSQRHRGSALMRRGAATVVQNGSASAEPILERAINDFETARRRGDNTEQCTIGLALALGCRGYIRYNQGRLEESSADLDRSLALMRPLASKTGARRARLELANLLNTWAQTQPKERAMTTCEEGRQILAGLGALDLSNLQAASAYGDISDTEAGCALTLGRFDMAERIEQEVDALAERILEKRPGDLRAMLDRIWAASKLAYVETRRFQHARAFERASEMARFARNYVTVDPAHYWGWAMGMVARQQMAWAALMRGEVKLAEQHLHDAISLADRGQGGDDVLLLVPRCWFDLAAIAAQRGERDSAEKTFANGARAVHDANERMKRGALAQMISAEALAWRERVMRLSFGDFIAVEQAARAALESIAKIGRTPEQSRLKEDIDSLRRAALFHCALAAMRLDRFSEAETAGRAAAAAPQGSGWGEQDIYGVNPETSRAFAQALLALALARQHKTGEARATVGPAVDVYRKWHKNGAEGVDFNHDFAFCLYVQAVACADDDASRGLRRTALEEAASLIAKLTHEAMALRDQRELREWIDAERAKSGGDK